MRRLTLGSVLAGVVLAIAVFPQHPWIAVVLFLAPQALIVYGTLRPTSQLLGEAITDFEPRGREVWLTIDDGPDPVDTPKILDLLDRYSAQATFFVKGERVLRFPDAARSIVERGHTIGNHSHTHPSGWFWAYPPPALRREIDSCNDAVESATGKRPAWFRAPVGFKNPFVHPLLRKRDMKLVAWSNRGFDAIASTAELAASRILHDIEPGSIILVHEAHDDRRDVTFGCIETVVETLSKEGYAFVVPEESRWLAGARKTKKKLL